MDEDSREEFGSPTSRPPSSTSGPLRKKLKLEIPKEEEDEEGGIEGRKNRLYERRSVRLKSLITSYKDNMTELYFLQSSENPSDCLNKKKPSFAFYNYLKLNKAPSRVLKELGREISTSSSTSVHDSPPHTSSPSDVSRDSKFVSPLSGGASPTTTVVLTPTRTTSVTSTSSTALTTPVTPTSSSSSLIKSSERRQSHRPPYHPRANFLSPVKYGENLQRTTSFMATNDSSFPPPRISRLSREQLTEKLKQETWVLRRVQDLIREGLWTEKRLPKVVERSRPKSHWDSLLNEMQWLAVDFYQERKWKKSAAKMLAYSAKEYVEKLEIKRRLRKEEEEMRVRRIAGFIASEIRTFWIKISRLAEIKLRRQQQVSHHQMLAQQLSYVTQSEEKLYTEKNPPLEGSSKDINGPLSGTKENGINEEEKEKISSISPISALSEDDESTIMEQELFEKRQEEEEVNLLRPHEGSRSEIELSTLLSDSRTPLSRLLRSDYPGVLSEYLDLYDELLQDQCSSSSSEDEASSDEDELELMTPPESGNTIEISINSLLPGSGSSVSANPSSNCRDIFDLAEEADQYRPVKSSYRLGEIQQSNLPLLRGGDLRDYQKIGVDWLISMHKSGLSCAVADEPGLGRKIMIIAFLSWLSLNDVCRKPHLLIVPVSSISSWTSHLRTWCPALTVQDYDGSDNLKKLLRKNWSGNKVVLTSYRIFFRDSYHFLKRSWNYLILHEAQNLGRVSQMTSILDLKSNQRLSILSGNLPSNPIDLWNLLYLLQPKTYFSHQEILSSSSKTFVEGTEEYAETVKKLHAVINPFLLRRMRSQVEKQLPIPEEKVYLLEMLPKQRRLYDDFLASPGPGSALEVGDPEGVSNVLRTLRNICDHPFLFANTFSDEAVSFPRIQLVIPKFVYSATEYNPFKNIDLNSMNFVFFTHETTLTVIISDRIRKSRASKALIEELPLKVSSMTLPPSVPSGRLTLEFQTSSNSTSLTRSSQSLQNTNPHILLSASVIKSLKSSVNKPLLPLTASMTASSSDRLGAFHKESLGVIATFNERRCMGLPLYGKDLVDMLTIVTSVRPCRSMFRGMGLVNCLTAFDNAESRIKDKNRYRYQTQPLRHLVNASTVAYKQIHSESTIQNKLSCYVSPVNLFPLRTSRSRLENDLNTLLLHSVNEKPVFYSHRSQLFWTLSSSTKLNKLKDILRDVLLRKERAAIFCETREMRDLIQLFLRQEFYSYVAIEPEDSLESKLENLLFYRESNSFVLLTSTRTSALGLNISSTGISHIILYDSGWDQNGFKSNPWVQGIACSRRVTIHRLLCQGSVEENISRKSVQRKIMADLKNGETPLRISKSALDDLFARHLRDSTSLKFTEIPLEKEHRRKEKMKIVSRDLLNIEVEKGDRAATLDWLWSSIPPNDIMHSVVIDLAELDPGCIETSSLKDFPSHLDIATHRLFDNLKPIERYGLIQHFNPDCRLSSFYEELKDHSLLNICDWEQRHQAELYEFEEEMKKLDSMALLTYTSEDAGRAWYGQTGQPMPLWPAPSPPNGTAPPIDGINNNDLIEFHLSFWYSTDRYMEDGELPPVYVKESLKRTSTDAGLSNCDALPEIKPKFRKEESAHAPKSLFDRPTPALIKARKDMRLQKFRGNVSGTVGISGSTTTTASPAGTTSSTPVNSAVAGIRTPLPRTQVEAENTPEWLIQEDWALHHAVKDLLELPLNLTVLHPGHTPNWDMVADMVNSVSRIYRGPRQCRNRYESIIVPREEGRILYDIITPPIASPASSVINNGSSPLNSSKKQKKGKNVMKMIPAKTNRPMKTSQLYAQDNNNKWTSLYRSRFESIKSVANKRTPTAKPLLVNPTQKNPKHAAVLAESGISYEIPLNPITVAQNRAERIQKEKQRTQQQQQHELTQQRIASAQAAANAAQQSAAATAARVVSTQQQVQQQAAATGGQTVVVGISQPQGVVAQAAAARVQQQQQQQQQLQEMVRSSNAAVVVSSPSTVVTLASLNRLQAAQKVLNQGGTVTGRPLTPHQVNLLRQQAILNKPGEQTSQGQKIRMQSSSSTAVAGTPLGSKVSVAVTPSGTLQATGVTVVTQAGTLSKTPQIRHLTTAPGGSKTASVRAMTEQDMKILVAKQQQLQATGKVQIPAHGNVTAAQLFAQAGIKVQEGGGSGQPVATLVKTVSAIGQQGQSVTIPVQSMNIPQVKAALSRGSQQMQMKLLQQQLLQRKSAGGTSGQTGAPQQQQRVAIGQGKGLPTQLIVQKNVPHQAVTVQQILKSAGSQLVSTTPHAVLTKQTGQQQSIQARVIPASSGGGRNPQTIQVVAASPGRDSRPAASSTASLANALVQGGHIKVANSQQILNQVSAALGQPVSMAVRTSDGVPVSVALRTTPTPVQQAKTIITSTANLNSTGTSAVSQQQSSASSTNKDSK